VRTRQYWVMPAVIGAVAPTLSAGAAFVVSAAGAGFVGGFLSSALSGASLGQAFETGVISAATAALTAGVIGPELEGIKTPGVLGFLERSFAHGLAGGVLNGVSAKLENGSFRDGFLAGFASEAASVGINGVNPDGGQWG